MTESEIIYLAENDARALVIDINAGNFDAAELTWAAEHLGKAIDVGGVLPCLLGLLGHPIAVVREGAIYGLYDVAHRPAVMTALLAVAENDPLEIIRGNAKGALNQ